MKKALSAVAVLLAACATDPSSPGQITEPPRGFTVQEAAVANATIGFGLDLMRQVAGHASEPNFMVSPLSASMALGMTLNGAAGQTFDDMRSTLGFGSLSDAEINEAYKGLIAQLRARDPKVEFNLANSIWHEQDFTPKQTFVDALQQNFDAKVAAIDFTATDAPDRISSWAEQETKGRIKDLIKQIAPNEVMFLVNATYFKSTWSSQFDQRSTHKAAFNKLGGGTVDVSMMSRDGSYAHADAGDVVAVELPYADSAFSMVVVAPKQGTSLAPVYAKLSAESWNGLLGQLRTGRILLSMPKFKVSFNTRLDPALKAMGMGIAFVPYDADFSRIADGPNLYITRVQQNTWIVVDETGSEAAAATAVGIGIVSAPPAVVIDRPFVFAIRERSSGTILFIGQVGDPSR